MPQRGSSRAAGRDRAGTPAMTALSAAGVAFTTHVYDTAQADHADHAGRGFGAHAAAALGVDARRIFKTLIVTVDGDLHCAVVPVAQHLDLKALAREVGGKKAALAEVALAQRATGYVVGGISPLGQRTRLPIVVDASARHFDTVLVSAGRRGLQIELAPEDLVRVTQASIAVIAA